MIDETFLTTEEVLEYLQVNLRTVYRLIKAGKLFTYRHEGFWACMDTFKEKQLLEDLYMRGQVPWEVWKNGNGKPHTVQR